MEIEYGIYPVAIGTSMALETILGIPKNEQAGQQHLPSRVPTYPFLYINMRTLLRNLIGAIKSPSYSDLDVVEGVKREMGMIATVVSNMTESKTQVVYYYSEEETIKRTLPYARFKDIEKDGTAKQKQKYFFEIAVFAQLATDDIWKGVNVVDGLITGSHPKAYIITHHPIDLLAAPNFEELSLLESHTGTVRGRETWSYKSAGKDAGRYLPMNKLTITLWGDGNNLLSSYPPSTKKIVLEFAKAHNWHSMTTKDKIIMDLDSMQDRPLADLLKKMVR